MIIPIALDDSRAIYVSPGLEHNAAILKIKVEERLQGCNKWLAYFQSEVGSVYVTAPIFEGGTGNRYEDGYIYINLVQALTCSSTQTLQLEGIVTNGDVIESIYRSKIYPRIFFDESIDGTPQELGAGVDVITQLVADEHTHDNKEMLDTLDENSFAGLHTHSNQTVLDKFGESTEGKAEYNSEVLFSAMRVDTVDDLPENPVLGDLCYVRNGMIRSEKLLLETGEKYGALYFAAYPELGTAPFSWVMSTNSNTVEVSFEPENGILIVSVNGVAAYVYNKTGSAVTVAGLYNEKDCVFPAGWSRLDTDTLILSSDGEFYSGTSLAPGGDYSLLASRFFPGYEIVSVTSGGEAVQSIEQNVLATRACFAQMNSGYWCCTEQGWKNTLLGKLSGSADAGTLFFGGGWIDMMRIVTNTFTPNVFTNAPGISEVTQEGAFTVDENGNLLYENKLLATRTQKLTVTAAYAAEVSATAIPAVEADPGNGVEAQDAVEGYYPISPNVMYDFGETTSLNLQLAPGVGGYVNEYMFRFSCGETASTFALPDCIEWIGSEPEMVANKIYECSIVDNRAVIA